VVVIIILLFLISSYPVFGEYSIKINGYSATNPEFVELINNSPTEINLNGWSIKNDNTSITEDIYLTLTDVIPANSTKKFNKDSTWLNDSGDIIYLYDASNNLVDKLIYSTPTSTPTSIPTSTTTPIPTVTSTPTATPTPTPTILITPTALPTDKNLYQLDESATASAIFTPTDESGFYTTPTISATPFASNLVLEQTTTVKKKYLPLFFIVSGGLLHLSPLLFDKLKKK